MTGGDDGGDDENGGNDGDGGGDDGSDGSGGGDVLTAVVEQSNQIVCFIFRICWFLDLTSQLRFNVLFRAEIVIDVSGMDGSLLLRVVMTTVIVMMMVKILMVR